jgi:hypothetical protein
MNRFELLLKRLREDFPDVKIMEDKVFHWRPYTREVGYDQTSSEKEEEWERPALLLLHEMAHAELGHEKFQWDMELLDMETAAWRWVRDETAARYEVKFDPNLAESKLLTYREWFWERSKCPECGGYGFQQHSDEYNCRSCNRVWRPNDNRFRRIWRAKGGAQDETGDFSTIEKLLG